MSLKPILQLCCMCLCGICFVRSEKAAAQTPGSTVNQIINSVNNYTKEQAIEKLYLQTDKPDYSTGDTLWFKGYLLNAATLMPRSKTGILYVEIADENNRVVRRSMVTVIAGLAWGNIQLNEESFPQGIYTLRAYTNWMRNNDEHYIFKKRFTILTNSNLDSWLINSKVNLTQEKGKPSAKMLLGFKDMQQRNVVAKDVQLALTEGRKVWFRNKFTIGVDGNLNFSFELPQKADPNKLAIRVIETKKDHSGAQYTVPVILNRKEHTDLQFMPEGGALVVGINTKVAFKALGEDGNAVDVSGIIVNSKQEKVATFKSTHQGMGEFYLQPQTGETYTAVMNLNNNATKTYLLPAVKPSGIVLNVTSSMNSDSVTIKLTVTPDIITANSIYYLVCQSRGIACYASALKFSGNSQSVSISKNIFPTGITRISLLDFHAHPLNERIIYIDHQDNLCVNISTDKNHYTARDSVGMDVTVTNKDGAPVQGVFSLAVTDDNQVKSDSLKNASLMSTLLLSSDLKGEVADPGYYFNTPPTEERTRNLDNLLLTQGWVNYNWQNVFVPGPQPVYAAEKEFTIRGKVTNVFNKPVKGTKVTMLSKKPTAFQDTITNEKGEFAFKNIYPSDTASYFIQTVNKRGKSFNVGIDVYDFVPPQFKPETSRLIPTYVNLDTTAISTTHNLVSYKLQQAESMGMHQLKEVVIKDKKIIKDSKNLNGPGESDLALNEADFEKAGKMTLGDVLRKNVKGLYVGGKHSRCYMIKGEMLMLIIDGVFVPKFYTGTETPEQFYNTYFDYFTAEDIKGIEIMYAGKYGGRYFTEYMHPLDLPFDYCYIEVTTRAGKGPFYSVTPGTYLYKPMAFIEPKEFYSPKYKAKTKNAITDIRSTIYWAPNIVTDKDGKAKVSFYTADNPGTYTILMEGTDLQGNIGDKRSKITVR